jgi:biopolymer transport protein ExbB/TolQ
MMTSKSKEALKLMTAAGMVALGSAAVTLLIAVPIMLGASYLERKAYDRLDAERLEAYRESMRKIAAEIEPKIEIEESPKLDIIEGGVA